MKFGKCCDYGCRSRTWESTKVFFIISPSKLINDRMLRITCVLTNRGRILKTNQHPLLLCSLIICSAYFRRYFFIFTKNKIIFNTEIVSELLGYIIFNNIQCTYFVNILLPKNWLCALF